MVGNINLHRFREYAAISFPSARTEYLSLKEARELSKALGRLCRSLERERFTGHTFGSVAIELSDDNKPYRG